MCVSRESWNLEKIEEDELNQFPNAKHHQQEIIDSTMNSKNQDLNCTKAHA